MELKNLSISHGLSGPEIVCYESLNSPSYSANDRKSWRYGAKPPTFSIGFCHKTRKRPKQPTNPGPARPRG